MQMTAKQLIESYIDDVVRYVDRRRRNDVGMELRVLLDDELQGQATDAGRPADLEMAIELLRRFGRPEDVALRYRKPGFAIIEPADGPAFVKLTTIGMAIVWILGAAATFRNGAGLERLSYWWMTFGLGAFWWPGFLVVCAGVAAWVRRQFPVAGEWQPRVIDRDRINRPAWVVAIAAAMLGTIWLTAPSEFVVQVTGGRLANEFYQSLVYDATFRQVRLPLLLTLLIAQLMLYATLVAAGRWQLITRRIDIILSLSISAMLVWSITAGHIFQGDEADRTARGAIALILLFVAWDIVVKVQREFARVRMPASMATSSTK
jgi:hypothetical protein